MESSSTSKKGFRRFLCQEAQIVAFRNNKVDWKEMEELYVNKMTLQEAKMLVDSCKSLKIVHIQDSSID